MLSSVILHCQVTMIVMNSDYQLSEFINVSKSLELFLKLLLSLSLSLSSSLSFCCSSLASSLLWTNVSKVTKIARRSLLIKICYLNVFTMLIVIWSDQRSLASLCYVSKVIHSFLESMQTISWSLLVSTSERKRNTTALFHLSLLLPSQF